MKRYAGWVVCFICLALAVLLLWHGVRMGERAKHLEQNGTLLLTETLSRERLEQMREAEGLQEDSMVFTAWREEKEVYLSAENPARSTQAKALWIDGPSELLLPFGKRLKETDTEGCLIDEGTAQELFGSVQVEGLTLSCGDRERLVQGVFPFPEKLVILQDTGEEAKGDWDRITIQSKDGQPVKDLGEKFLIRHGLTGEVLRWDILRGLSWLTELVPGKWSDFSGWSRNIEEKRREFRILTEVRKSAIELEYQSLLIKRTLCLALGGVGLWTVIFVMLGKITTTRVGNFSKLLYNKT